MKKANTQKQEWASAWGFNGVLQNQENILKQATILLLRYGAGIS